MTLAVLPGLHCLSVDHLCLQLLGFVCRISQYVPTLRGLITCKPHYSPGPNTVNPHERGLAQESFSIGYCNTRAGASATTWEKKMNLQVDLSFPSLFDATLPLSRGFSG